MCEEQEQRLLRIAARVARVGGWEIDLDARQVLWSDEVCRLHDVPRGFTPSFEESFSFYSEEWRAQMRTAYARCAETGVGFERKLQIVGSAGRRLWVRVTATAVRDAQGAVTSLQGTMQDLSPRPGEDSDGDGGPLLEHLRELGDALPQIVWMARPDGVLDYVNKSGIEYCGAVLADAPENWIEVLHPEDVSGTLAAWQACLASGAPYSSEFRIRWHDGSYRWHVTSAKPVRDDAGRILKWYGASLDIHDSKLAAQQIGRLARRLETTLESITDAFYMLDAEWRFSYVNAEAERLLQRKREQLLGKMIWEEYPQLFRSRFCAEYRKALTSGRTAAFEEFYLPTGIWADVRVYPSEEGLAINFRDVTERRMAEHQLKLAATGFAHMAEGLVVVDANARIVSVNPAFTRMTGYTLEEVAGRVPRELLHEPTRRHVPEFFREIADAACKDDFWEGEIWCRRKNGEIFPQLLSLAAVRDSKGEIVNHVAVFNDITKLKEHEQRLELIAHHDGLTELPNRVLLLDRLEHAVALSSRNGMDGALLFIDLDNFKALNDTLGHHKGDKVLQQIGLRLAGAVRDSDTVARLGGDEFVVMLEGLSSDRAQAMEQVRRISEKLTAAIILPCHIGQQVWCTTASIGVTLFSDGDRNKDELLKRADLAMYQAKAGGRNTIRFFDAEMQAVARARAALQAELSRALERREFVLHYQPLVDNSGSVAGVEALVRWLHPQQGMISPAKFIPLAEETRLILPLGQWVLETACSELAAWAADPAMAGLSMAVNVSARQFHCPGFERQVLDILAHTGADPRKLKLELTESMLVDDMDNAVAKMSRLKASGLSFALDDFGTGYSSLSYLKRLPLNQLKLDQSFVKDVLRDAKDRAIACTVLTLGRSLGLEVVSEGVETAEQYAFLKQNGSCAYQGHWFSAPLSADELKAFVRAFGAAKAVSPRSELQYD